MPPSEVDPKMRKALELWVDSESKVRLLAFYRKNPGVIETLDGLAQRLAYPAVKLERELADHVEVGVIRERVVGAKRLYLFDRSRCAELERLIEGAVQRGDRGAGS